MKRAALGVALHLCCACTTHTTPPDSAPPYDSGASEGAPCALTTDCEVGLLCGYSLEAGCAAAGVCVPEDLSCPMDGPTVCACDGTPVGLACIYGPGYAAVPVPGATPGCGPDFDAGFTD